MAIVQLPLDDAAEGYLPETCMKCGDKAEHFVKKKFSWHPSWVWILILAGFLPFAIVAMIMTKRATLIAPMCTAHRRHWTIRTAVSILGLLGIVALIFLMVLVGTGAPGRRNDNTLAIVGFTLLGGGIGWVIAMIALAVTSIRPQEITEDELILQGVSDQFADDYERCVEEDEQKERERRARRKQRARLPETNSAEDDRYR